MNAIRQKWSTFMSENPGAWEDILAYLGITSPSSMVRITDPITAKRAEKHSKPRRGSQRFRILEFLAGQPEGATADEWEGKFGWRSGPRAVELKRMGFILDTGKTAKTRFGEDAIVYQITDAGMIIVRQAAVYR